MHVGGEGIQGIHQGVDPNRTPPGSPGQLNNPRIQPNFEIERSGEVGRNNYTPRTHPNDIYIEPRPNPAPPPRPRIQETENQQIIELEEMAEEIPPIILQDDQCAQQFDDAISVFRMSVADSAGLQNVLDAGENYFQISEDDYQVICASRRNYNELRRRGSELRGELDANDWGIVSELIAQQRTVVSMREQRWEQSVDQLEQEILVARFGQGYSTIEEYRNLLSNEDAVTLAEFFEENHSPRAAQRLYELVAQRDSADIILRDTSRLASLRIDINSNDSVRIRNAVSGLETLRQSIAGELRNSHTAEENQTLHNLSVQSWGLLYEGMSFLRYGRNISESEMTLYDSRMVDLEEEYDAMVGSRSGEASREESESFMQNMRRIAAVYALREGRIDSSFRPAGWLNYVMQLLGQSSYGLRDANRIYQSLIARFNATADLVRPHMSPTTGDSIFEDFSDVMYMTFVEAPRRVNLPDIALNNLRYIQHVNHTALDHGIEGMFSASALGELLCCPPVERLDITVTNSYQNNIETFRTENPHLFANRTSQPVATPVAVNMAPASNADQTIISSFLAYLGLS
ncbi:MAG: hypothetical protein ABH859_01425 [Pseudomonadota bacterium]